jgi:hypothetical protein
VHLQPLKKWATGHYFCKYPPHHEGNHYVATVVQGPVTCDAYHFFPPESCQVFGISIANATSPNGCCGCYCLASMATVDHEKRRQAHWGSIM